MARTSQQKNPRPKAKREKAPSRGKSHGSPSGKRAKKLESGVVAATPVEAVEAPIVATAPPKPLLLDARNFTPRHRTPWGGTRLASGCKRELLDESDDKRIGESWELSMGPELPSRLDDGRALPEVVATDPATYLGREAERGASALLVKLIDAGDDLSVQIHPEDGYSGLADGDTGKPESWYVVDREPGAALYLGLAPGVTQSDVEHALASGGDVARLLERVPVEQGDFFVIDAGTAHAIGRGITLVEPQHVTPGKKGVTYRYWDWNRKYDADGKPDTNGEPRPLHAEHAIAVTNWRAPRGATFLEARRVRAGKVRLNGPPRLLWLAHSTDRGAVRSAHIEVARLEGTGPIEIDTSYVLNGVTVLEGALRVAGVDVVRGRSVAIPAALGKVEITLQAAHAILSRVVI